MTKTKTSIIFGVVEAATPNERRPLNPVVFSAIPGRVQVIMPLSISEILRKMGSLDKTFQVRREGFGTRGGVRWRGIIRHMDALDLEVHVKTGTELMGPLLYPDATFFPYSCKFCLSASLLQ